MFNLNLLSVILLFSCIASTYTQGTSSLPFGFISKRGAQTGLNAAVQANAAAQAIAAAQANAGAQTGAAAQTDAAAQAVADAQATRTSLGDYSIQPVPPPLLDPVPIPAPVPEPSAPSPGIPFPTTDCTLFGGFIGPIVFQIFLLLISTVMSLYIPVAIIIIVGSLFFLIISYCSIIGISIFCPAAAPYATFATLALQKSGVDGLIQTLITLSVGTPYADIMTVLPTIMGFDGIEALTALYNSWGLVSIFTGITTMISFMFNFWITISGSLGGLGSLFAGF